MRFKLSYRIIFSFLTVYNFSFSQLGEKKENYPIHFGVQTKLLLPSDFLGPVKTTLSNEGFQSILTQKTGYSYGGLIRADFTKNVTLECGINYIQRQFKAEMSYSDSSVTVNDTNNLTFINYELPITGIVKIQLARNIYSLVGLGPSFTFKPTNVALIDLPGGKHTFYHSGSVKKFGIDLNAQAGFELRTKKSGYFYLGGGVKVPTSYLFNWGGKYAQQGSSESLIDFEKVNGAFLSIDLRYYLPNIRNSGMQFIKGPVE
jgi:hypothetical protein